MMVAVVAIFVSCEDEKGYYISGTIDAADGTEIYISELDNNNNLSSIIDTTKVLDGKFELDLPEKESPTLSFLTVEKTRGNVLFIADNLPITFQINKDSLFASQVTGGKDNAILYSYLGELRASNKRMGTLRNKMMAAYSSQDSVKLEELQQTRDTLVAQNARAKKELVKSNPNSIVSLLILQEMINSRRFTTKELMDLYGNLSPEIKNSTLGKTLGEKFEKLSKLAIGSKAPNFSGPTPEGEEISLNEIMGEVTLIDFWASWCKPCRAENPNIVRVYEKYHDKGFNIIGVSLDRPGQKAQWVKAIEEDNLTWNQVSNLQFWQGPIARKYEIRAIPAAFLLDENGVIVARNLRGEDLENKVAELLGEEQ